MTFLRLLLAASLLWAGPALAFDASQFTSPTYNTLQTDRLTVQGSGSTGEVSGMTVTPSGFGSSATLAAILGVAQAHVPTNAALKTAVIPFAKITRDGFYAAGDGGSQDYTWSGTNCSTPDNGAQVQPTARTGCWLADFKEQKVLAQVFGAKGDGSDDGPAVRAACAALGPRNRVLLVDRYLFLTTLDPSGLGALVMGTGATGAAAPSCDIAGTRGNLIVDNAFVNGLGLFLGNGLNRPLVYVRKNTKAPRIVDVFLHGNKTNQTGWAGGPNGKLYTVMLEDDTVGGAVEAGVHMHDVIMYGGFNGNFYEGSGRGSVYFQNVWSMYSGQTLADHSVYWNGYDATTLNLQIGNNSGYGQIFAEGGQYQQYGGAIFLNGAAGTLLNGYKVTYFNQNGTNYQYNGMGGVKVVSSAPFPGSQSAGYVLSQVVFDGNSTAATGTYSDVSVDGTRNVTLSQPMFVGSTNTAGQIPKYNVEALSGASVTVVAPTFGTVQANTSGFTNNCALLMTSANVTCTWVPALRGQTTAGSATYSARAGSYQRTGNTVTATFSLALSSLGGASGPLLVGGLPFFNTATSGDNGSCSFSAYGGWTPPAGFTLLGAIVPPSLADIYLVRSGSGSAFAPQVAASEMAAAMSLTGTCTYHVDN